jgi:LemA protein
MNLLIGVGTIVGIVVAVVLVVVAITIVCWAIATHNKLIAMKNNTEEAFHNIDIYLKKRYDLIPNLVETVKGYAKHESETFTKVTEARSKVAAATTNTEKIEANAQLSQALKSFNVVMEKYPELKANANFLDLQNELKNIETTIANSRKYYNGNVKAFNTKIQIFPSSIIARMMKLEKQPYFEIEDEEERKNVKVSF